MIKEIIFVFCLLLLFATNVWGTQVNKPTFKTKNSRTGFLVIAPDRGFIGNNETNSIFQNFNKDYLAEIIYVGRKYDGLNSNYSEYIQEALTSFNNNSVSNIVILPLFLSKYNHILKEIRKNISAYQFSGKIYFNETISESYLSAQILLDHINKLSKNPSKERIVILGRGAVDKKSEILMKGELEKLSDYVKKRHSFKSIQTGIYYSYNSQEKLREIKDKEVDEIVIHTAAKKGKTLVVPFFIGPKYSNMMSLTHFFDRKFADIDLIHNSDEILLHPNYLHWMKKTANSYLPVSSEETIGVVIMPHGATKPYNDAVEKTIAPLKLKYKVEMAYGMGDSVTIQKAVYKLEKQGIKKIVFVRMYPTSNQLKEKTNYILGLSDKIPLQWDGLIPAQIRNSAIINTFGGYEEDNLIAGIFLERIKEFSKKPEEETIILLAHGESNDKAEILRKKRMKKHIDWVQKNFSQPFKKIIGLALREDWPEKRENALNEIKKIIKEGNKDGKVIVISNRLYGSGPYQHYLKGLNFKMNSKGLAPHPNLTNWLEKGIDFAIRNKFITKNKKDISQWNPGPPEKVTLASD
jgi:protoheme ferro-lyase|tara:strand:- start:334 stop:2067 length:1734 start_codon:yes stop_codon:yes gene_type:complete